MKAETLSYTAAMHSPSAIFRKTELGNAEVATRAMGLRAELRRLLILIDGKKPISTLAMMVRPAEVDTLINELVAVGVIESSSASAAQSTQSTISTVPGTQGSVEASNSPSPEQFIAARKAGVRFLNDALGPSAESLAIKLERARDPQELREVVTQIRTTLERTVSTATSQRFLDAMRDAAKP